MLVIWGFRVLNAVLGTGLFHCPSCDLDTQYRHLQPRRWFTLFFIPIIPLGRLDPHVECTRCKGTFYERVLQRPTLQQFEHQVGLAHRAAIAHLASLARQPRPAVTALALRSLTSYGEQALATDISAFATESAAAEPIRPLATYMSVDGREAFLRRVIGFAVQLGDEPTPPINEALTEYSALVGLSPTHADGIRRSVEQQLRDTTTEGVS
jgi:hypothetical protein